LPKELHRCFVIVFFEIIAYSDELQIPKLLDLIQVSSSGGLATSAMSEAQSSACLFGTTSSAYQSFVRNSLANIEVIIMESRYKRISRIIIDLIFSSKSHWERDRNWERKYL
jgi:hypothetical protein